MITADKMPQSMLAYAIVHVGSDRGLLLYTAEVPLGLLILGMV